jgi:hypothetical protein
LEFAAVAADEDEIAGRRDRAGVARVGEVLLPDDLPGRDVDRIEVAGIGAADRPDRADVVDGGGPSPAVMPATPFWPHT